MMKPLDPFTIDLEKTTLIEASAGTGKTYTITTLLCRLVAMGYAVDTILVVTFTEAAAAELKLRIRNRLSRCLDFLENQRPDEDDELAGFLKGQKDAGLIRQRIRNAINDFDLSAIMTIHAFCLQSLKENAFESASYFDITLSPGNAPYLKQVCQDFFVKEVYGLPPIFLRFLKTKGFTQENVMSPFSKAVSRPDIRTVPLEQEFCDVCDQYRDLVKKIGDLLKGSMDEIIDLFLSHKGIDKRSYNKKWVPQWLKDALNTIEASRSRDILFTMTEKGDSLYKFTRSRLASKTKEGASPPFHELFDLCEELLDLYTIFEKNLISLKIRLISFIHGEFEKIKQTRGICFFDDLVNDLAKALNGELAEPLIKNCQKRYRACLIDEFQDTDPIQYFIFSKLFGNTHRPFFMIGDPKQAIYAFRGGDIFAYLCACKQSDQRFTLDKNFRSSPLLVKAVNQIFSHADNPFLFEDIEFVNVSTPEFSRDLLIENETAAVPLNVCFVPAPANGPDPKTIIAKDAALKMVPRVLAHQIIQLLNSDKRLRKADNGYRQITPGDIGVLVRTNAQAQMVQQALTLVGVPSFLSKTGSVFETKEAMDMLDLLCAVQEPGNMGLLKAALCTGIFNYSGNMIADIEKDEQQIMFWLERFYEFKETWDNKGFISMIQSVFHWDSAFLNPDNPLSERVLTNFYHLSELIAQEALQKHLGAFYLLKWFKAQLIKEFREETAEELRLESDKQAVAIVTIHKSKGLEYPIVYLPYLWEMGGGRQKNREVFFHDPKEDYLLKLDLGSNALEAASDLAAIEEEAEQRRLLYVALTRAAAMCTVIWGHFKGVENSSLGALLHPKGCKDDDSMLADLELLYKNNEQSIGVKCFDDSVPIRAWDKEKRESTDFRPQKFKGQVLPEWKMTSFSAITFLDHLTSPKNETSGSLSLTTTPSITLEKFPRGTGSGDFFHLIFEDLDFTVNAQQRKALVQSKMAAFGLHGKEFLSLADVSVNQVLHTLLSDKESEFALKDIGKDQRFNELEFLFSVERFNKSAVADLFKNYMPEQQAKTYAPKILQLSSQGFKGFIKGFIDLVFCHQDRWYIIDYKSNYLGNTYADYDLDAIHRAMAEHHYFLQYHIYLVALHRYLSIQLKNYDYQRDFGGVFYLFIRGMHPDFGSRYGVFFDRPDFTLVEKLSQGFLQQDGL